LEANVCYGNAVIFSPILQQFVRPQKSG